MKGKFYSDTNEDVEQLQSRLLRDLSPWRKMAIWSSLNQAALRLARVGLRSHYPDADEKELRRRLADLLLGQELAEKVYGKVWYAD